MARKPWIADRKVAQAGGITFVMLGGLMLWDAFEGRGRMRPFWAKLLPGG